MAMEFVLLNNGWWELDRNKLTAYNYMGGYNYITEEALSTLETFECDSWHELYSVKHFCPLEATTRCSNGWISPEGKIYEATSHEVTAEDLLEIIYGMKDNNWPGDTLEELGWIKVTTSLMWEIRLNEWATKELTQCQIDTLWEWCSIHNKTFPYIIKEE